VIQVVAEEVAMLYGPPAVRRAMTVREVMVRAMSGEYSWYRTAGLSTAASERKACRVSNPPRRTNR
jgi:hypothetical protein